MPKITLFDEIDRRLGRIERGVERVEKQTRKLATALEFWRSRAILYRENWQAEKRKNKKPRGK